MPVVASISPEDLAAADIQCCQIGQRTVTHVLKFVAARLTGGGCERRDGATRDLQRTLFIRREHVSCRERLVVPAPLIQLQDHAGFRHERRVTWEEPTPVIPGANGILVQQAPDGADTDRRDNVSLLDPQRNLAQREATEGQFQLGRLLTSDGLDLGHLGRRELHRAPGVRGRSRKHSTTGRPCR